MSATNPMPYVFFQVVPIDAKYTAHLSPSYLAESRVPAFLAGCIVPFSISTIAFLARSYTRAVIMRRWGIDDSFLVAAWIGAVAILAIDFAMVDAGIGKHIQTTTLAQGVRLMKLSYAVRLVYIATLSVTKLAFGFFYLRIFIDRRSRFICYAIIAYVILYTIPLLLTLSLQCNPVTDSWKISTGQNGKPNCPVNAIVVVTLTCVFNVVGDLALLVFVVPKIVRLHMPLKQKIALLLVAVTSLLVVVAALIRATIVPKRVRDLDQTWIQVNSGIASVVEVNTGIFCASIIAVKPLIRKLFPRFFASRVEPSDYPNTPSWGRKAGQILPATLDSVELGPEDDFPAMHQGEKVGSMDVFARSRELDSEPGDGTSVDSIISKEMPELPDSRDATQTIQDSSALNGAEKQEPVEIGTAR